MKKLLSLALVIAMVLTMSVTAFAQEITGESGSTDITYTANESYVVTIPDSMSVGTDANVSVSNVTLASNKQLTVSVSSTQYNDGWKLKNGDDTIGYTLKIDGTDVANNGTVLTVKSGETATKTLVTAVPENQKPKYSGRYTDTLTFNVSCKVEITEITTSGDWASSNGWNTEVNLDGSTGTIGTADAGKTGWVKYDEIFVTLISPKYGEQNATLIYDGSKWNLNGSLLYLENETPTVSAIYAPCYEVTGNTMNWRVGMLSGMTEYLEVANYTLENGIIGIGFAGMTRNYSRLRIVGLAGETYTVTTTDFTTPAGIIPEATEPYTLTADEKGNAYLYGTFAEGATVTVKQDDVTLASYQFTAETEQGKSYALDARPIIDLSQYTEGTTVDITEDCVIIGDGTEYNVTLNVTEDATVIFDVRTSGVKLGGSINVAGGKTLTLLVKGNAEHTVKDGISLSNSSNVIIEGDLIQENNKLTVTSSGGNAGIGANNGVTAGDITIRNARVDATGSGSSSDPYVSGAGIGTANASMGDILIEGSTITAAGGYYGKYSHAAAIGMGSHVGTMGNITLKDSKITANNNGDGLASVIGAGGQRNGDPGVGTLGDIIITNTDLNLSMAIYNMNSYGAIIGPGIGYSDCYVNMGKIVFTDVTQTQLDEMIPNWLPSNFYYLYALGKGSMGIDNEYQTFEGVWVSDGNGGIVQIGDESGYSWQDFTGF